MAIKTTNRGKIIFSKWFYKLLDLKSLIQKIFLMSHVNDVINNRFKKGVQKQQKKEISKNKVPFQLLKLEYWILWNDWLRYFLIFTRTLSEGQEIVQRIKYATEGNLKTRTWKIIVFSLLILLIKLQIPLFFSFSRFRVTWPGNRVRKNLPIDFEILILNFEPSYGLLYIKRMRVICRTQKYALKSNSKIVVKITVIFRYEWSKWPFCTKSS